jgi:putative ABC transport system permease protein
MGFWRRLRNLAGEDRHSREIEEELALHLDLKTEENTAAGMAPDEARRDAIRAFGNRTALQERTRDLDVPLWLDRMAQDLRFALRGLRSGRGSVAILILSLALGIGANTALFTLLYTLLLRPLPVHDPSRLYRVELANPCSCGWVQQDTDMNYALATGFTRAQSIFSDNFLYSGETLDVATRGEIRLVSGAFVSPEIWRTLGIQPAFGRGFTPNESTVAVISDALWEREFERDRSVLGRVLQVGGKPVTVVGVAPPRFFGLSVGDQTDIYLPIAAAPLLHAPDNPLTNGRWWWLTVIGRLRPGVTPQQAAAQASAMSAGLTQTTLPPDFPKDQVPNYLHQQFEIAAVGSGFSAIREYLSLPLRTVSALAAMLLLLACANIANLQLSRSLRRRQEFAVRLALGASRSRLACQVLLESLLASLFGATAGLFLAPALTRLLVATYATQRGAVQLDLHQDVTILAFTAVISLLTAALFGSVPALYATNLPAGQSLRLSRGNTGPGANRLRKWLLGTQVALALILTTGAVLFSGTLVKLMTLDAGFSRSDLLLIELETARAGIAKEQRPAYYRELLERMRSVPGVQLAAASYVTPIKGNSWQMDILVDDGSGPQARHSYFNFVTADFLAAFGTPVVEGRGFTSNDDRQALHVALVNQEFVRTKLGGGPALGYRIRTKPGAGPMRLDAEIIGVVKDARYRDLRSPVPPTVYVAMAQDPQPPAEINLALQVRGPFSGVTPAIRRIFEQTNPKVGYLFHSFRDQVSESLANERAIAAVASLFGVLALLLATAGIYGIVSYWAVQRRGEMGIRMALGSTASGVVRLLLAETSRVVVLGIAGGVLVAAWAAGFARSMLYGLTPGDPWVYFGSAAIIVLVALVASVGPAFRAARQDPMETLRTD